ncbi:hypothetical protein C5Y93_20555 [Blastopirellula marina]|uniref:Uncharacterized protein n=1 Tax=Blastopirellula marina TaxID=124 RepID=A0A2S8GIS5_9BACT|nr:hypothetical protein C5Y93_20555 [Blastopirellula marina]
MAELRLPRSEAEREHGNRGGGPVKLTAKLPKFQIAKEQIAPPGQDRNVFFSIRAPRLCEPSLRPAANRHPNGPDRTA